MHPLFRSIGLRIKTPHRREENAVNETDPKENACSNCEDDFVRGTKREKDNGSGSKLSLSPPRFISVGFFNRHHRAFLNRLHRRRSSENDSPEKKKTSTNSFSRRGSAERLSSTSTRTSRTSLRRVSTTSSSSVEINTWDAVTNKRIAKLDPRIKKRVVNFINEAHRQGIKLRVVQGFRSFDEQNKLYAKGRTRAELDAKGLHHISAKPNENRVTNVTGGKSSHNWGLAVDVVPMVNGKPVWNGDWKKISTIGKNAGLKWGGDWTSFVDRPHFYASLRKDPSFAKKK
ncbi:MAG: M15 family metallopeptidase [Myxococcota bacterium]|jgi:hypothetical protein|nr:M15 family metallopeptidase [Myxococcota bacterium]